MKIPSYVWVLLTLIVGFGFLAFLIVNKNSQNNTFQNVTLPIVVDEYVDYNCPHCAEFAPFVQEVRDTYGDKVKITTKNLPILTSGQQPDTSLGYAYYAEAVRLQGEDNFNKFSFDMFKWVTYKSSPNNTIFTYSNEEKQLFVNPVNPLDLAQFLKLDVEKLKQDVVTDAIKNAVKDQKAFAVNAMGSPSTPAVFIFGKQFKLQTYQDL